MHIVFLNPQGNFDHNDSFWTEHPDFGGQLVYVKEVASAMSRSGHTVDIVTRRFSDSTFDCFDQTIDHYPHLPNLRIVRLPCGPDHFLKKEDLWPHLNEWTNHIIDFYAQEGRMPDFITSHYGDGGLAAAIIKNKTGIPYSFTGHSLGAQKLEKLRASMHSLEALDEKYHFATRIEAERTAMDYADLIFVSTAQEQLEQYGHPLYKDVTDFIQEHFVIAPPGANTDVFTPAEKPGDREYQTKFERITKRDISPSRLGLPYIVLASRLDPKKNHIGLIEAYAKNKKLHDMANVAISLRGIDNAYDDYSSSKPDEVKILDQIMTVIRQRNLIGKVVFISINSQSELAAFYRYMAKRRSIFALTALYEPFGLAPIEAMSTGLPAAVTMYGGPSEVLKEDGKAFGVLLDVFNENNIASGLLEAFDHYDTYQAQGLLRVQQKYTWKATANAYIQAILNKTVSHPQNVRNTIHIPSFFTEKNHPPITLDFIKYKLLETESYNER